MQEHLVEIVKDQQNQLAIILRSNYTYEGIKFFTPTEYSQQLAYMQRPKGYTILPHVHNAVKRDVYFTKEVLYIKSGKVRVDFYSENKVYLESRLLFGGDIILLAFGGHGFEMVEASEIIEIKQGPYAGEHDKTRFETVKKEFISLK